MASATGIRTTEGWQPNEATARIMARVDMEAFVRDVDWDDAIARLDPPPMPDYVRSSIHGLEGGYGTPFAAETWDAVVVEIFNEYFGTEEGVRDDFVARVEGAPARILDVACGTGESTRALRRRFPGSRIVAFDVSPYMAAVAERKLAGDPDIEVRCLDAERMPFEDGSFDLVTASLLFHELPRAVSPAVLREMRRVVRAGGQVAVLEPYEVGGQALRPIPFPEPYLKDYLETDWDAAFVAAGFADVRASSNGNGWSRVARAA